jgi:hypothetical protein
MSLEEMNVDEMTSYHLYLKFAKIYYNPALNDFDQHVCRRNYDRQNDTLS